MLGPWSAINNSSKCWNARQNHWSAEQKDTLEHWGVLPMYVIRGCTDYMGGLFFVQKSVEMGCFSKGKYLQVCKMR